MLAKIGPLTKTSSRLPVETSSWMMSVPVMSAGIRSGVNWMRLKRSSRTRARVLISRVLARPGTPVIIECAPTIIEMITCSTTASWAMITLRNSRRISWYPCLSFSTCPASSVTTCPMFSISALSPKLSAISFQLSVSQRVHHVVHAILVGFVGLLDRHERVVRPLPVLADVVVVVDHHHQPPVVVAHPQILRYQVPRVGRGRKELRDVVEAVEDR